MQNTFASVHSPASPLASVRSTANHRQLRRIRSNAQKHTSRNPLQRWLIDRFHARVAAALRAHAPQAPRLALDLGCGEGFDARALRGWGVVGRVVGIDADIEALREAAVAGGVLPICADAGSLPFADSTLPVAVCLEVLEHLSAPEAALRELGRVAGGVLILSVPHQPFFSLANFLRGKNWRTWGDDPDHRHAWRPAAFVQLVEQRVDIQEVGYAFPWLIVVARARKP